jgi:excisionase family DNA binding protein
MQMINRSRFLTVSELASLLDISECTVKRLVKSKQLPCKHAGSDTRFNLCTLLKHFQRLEGGAA